MKSGIYKISCTANNKIYIGSAQDIEERFYRHKLLLNKNKHHNIYLQRAWNIYGSNVFAFEVIEFCQPQDLIFREQFWIDAEKPRLMNMAFVAGSRMGVKHSPEAINKIKAAGTGRKISPETIEKRRQSLKRKGIKLTKECLEKAADARRGKPPSQQSIDFISTLHKGKKQDPDHVEKRISKIRKNYVLTSPDGQDFEVSHLAKFCKEHSLLPCKICNVVKGRQRHHKGWTARYA